MSRNFQHLLPQQKADQIDQLLHDIEKISLSINRFNALLNEAGNPINAISIRYKGHDQSTFFGETTVAMDLQRLQLLNTIDRFDLCFPAKAKGAA